MSDISPGFLTSPPVPSSSPKISFTNEIQQMMFGFGDSSNPLPESAALVEEILRSQLSCLLYRVCEAALLRNGKQISLEDFLFTLRHDKGKLRRLLRFLSLKDLRNQTCKNMDGDDSADFGFGETISPGMSVRRRVKVCRDFFSNIDSTGELLSLIEEGTVDDVKLERLARADQRSQSMDAQKYRQFHEARLVSLYPGNRNSARQKRFRDWLMADLQLELKPNGLAMEVLGYLANEIVAQIVDLALLVRKDRCRTCEDPITNAMPPIYTHPLTSPDPATPIKLESSLTSPNLTSPSMDITSPPTMNLNPNQRKTKKWGKTDGGVLEPQTSVIQTDDIQEVMRRYSHAIGPFAAYEKPAFLAMKHSLLCG